MPADRARVIRPNQALCRCLPLNAVARRSLPLGRVAFGYLRPDLRNLIRDVAPLRELKHRLAAFDPSFHVILETPHYVVIVQAVKRLRLKPCHESFELTYVGASTLRYPSLRSSVSIRRISWLLQRYCTRHFAGLRRFSRTTAATIVIMDRCRATARLSRQIIRRVARGDRRGPQLIELSRAYCDIAESWWWQ